MSSRLGTAGRTATAGGERVRYRASRFERPPAETADAVGEDGDRIEPEADEPVDLVR